MDAESNTLKAVYDVLLDHYGAQAWWPADDHFEVMVGAILTQNTAWTNVEKAIVNLKQQHACDADSLAEMELEKLAQLIRSSGYFNQKAKRLKGFAQWYLQQGGFASLASLQTAELRDQLLALHGIGDETADDMILYAFDKPSFVIDAYTRRIFSRLRFFTGKESYAQLQNAFQQGLPPGVDLFKQYHALIVLHAKRHCNKKPDCSGCPLSRDCAYQHES